MPLNLFRRRNRYRANFANRTHYLEQPFIQKLRYTRYQGVFLAVALGVISNQCLLYFAPEWALTDKHLVRIPVLKIFPA